MIDAQLATGATHDMRILTGSAAMAALTPKKPKAHAPASADLNKRMIFLPVFAGPARQVASFSPRAKIVGGPTDFGKVGFQDAVPRSGTWAALVWRNIRLRCLDLTPLLPRAATNRRRLFYLRKKRVSTIKITRPNTTRLKTSNEPSPRPIPKYRSKKPKLSPPKFISGEAQPVLQVCEFNVGTPKFKK